MTSTGDADGPKSTPSCPTISTSTRQLKDLIENALAPIRKDVANLPNSDYIDAIIDKLTTKLEDRFEEQDRRLNALEECVHVLESKLAVLGALDARIEENEQYSRRFCLRFHGIALPKDGKREDCVKKVADIMEKNGLWSWKRSHRQSASDWQSHRGQTWEAITTSDCTFQVIL
eukprot:Seg1603.18 transcript_id=Seg1603.18/GoldUCD/mRNA.D3Y31 product="hypothetical protein" protein_id=Seg1603.18/GoldUCD/D3Y31